MRAGPSNENKPNEERDYRAFACCSADVTAVVTADDGVLRYVSPACGRSYGWDADALAGTAVVELVHPDDAATLTAARLELPEHDVLTTTFRVSCGDGSYRWTEANCRLVDGDGERVIVVAMRDIAAREEQTAALQMQAQTDPLTGLANRIVLMDRLRHGIQRLDRLGNGLAVIYLDLDRFKIINDSLGHRIGDQVLLSMAARLTEHLRPADTLARLGGDEFVIVAEDMPDHDSALDLAHRVLATARETIQLDERAFQCTVSAGIAWTADSDRDADELLREADLALYRAKNLGRDRAIAFDEDLRASTANRRVIERMVRHAIEERRVFAEYQPIIDLRTRTMVAVEAFARIREPDGAGALSNAFLEVAEETGLLVDLDEVVHEMAIADAALWHVDLADHGFKEVAINVTGRHLVDPQFADSLLDRLNTGGIPPQGLSVELTERTLIEASRVAITGLHALRAGGVRVGLDDFGTGFSSLAYLRHFPLDFVKIDRTFISELEGSSADRAIVGAIIGLCHALGMTVIAEGVETVGQLRILDGLECDRAQGFHLAPPMAAAQVREVAGSGLDTKFADLTA